MTWMVPFTVRTPALAAAVADSHSLAAPGGCVEVLEVGQFHDDPVR